MKLLPRAVSSLTVSLILCAASCNGIKVPAPNQPQVAAALMTGHRLCGSLTVLPSTYTFDCAADPLPTNGDTGWQLTPLRRTEPDGKSVLNTTMELKVTTPSLTDLQIESESPSGSVVTQKQIPPAQGTPKNFGGPNGQVGVNSTDDGTVKTWSLVFTIGTCTNVAKAKIIDTDGTRLSNPLVVYFFRDPAETDGLTSCSGEPNYPGNTWGTSQSSTTSGPGQPSGHNTPTCGQLGVCVNCAALHPAGANQWSASAACNIEDYKKTYGYENPDGTPTAHGQVCTVVAQPDRAKCEVP